MRGKRMQMEKYTSKDCHVPFEAAKVESLASQNQSEICEVPSRMYVYFKIMHKNKKI